MITGKNTYIHPTAVIGPNVQIGDHCHIGPLCIIGYPAEWKSNKEDKGVVIGNGVRLTGLVTVDSGGEKKTVIGDDCYLMKHSHIGHDAQVGNDVTISCGAKIGGHVIIGDKTNIGLNAVIHQKQSIAPSCMIGMGAVITKKLITIPESKYAGNPAKYLGPNIKP